MLCCIVLAQYGPGPFLSSLHSTQCFLNILRTCIEIILLRQRSNLRLYGNRIAE